MTPDSTNPSLSRTGGPGGVGQHRSLSDDVLQSAEDAVVSQGADDFAGLSRGDYVARSGGGDLGSGDLSSGVESPYTGRIGTSAVEEDAAGFFSRMESKVTRYVATEPAKAALMAAGAGALLAILMGRRRGRR